jgi:hypothetical protein
MKVELPPVSNLPRVVGFAAIITVFAEKPAVFCGLVAGCMPKYNV